MNQQLSNQPLSLTQQSEAERSFLTRTFLWMALGVLVTAVVAEVISLSPSLFELIYGNEAILFGLLFAQLIVVLVLSVAINRMSPLIATLIFFGYAALMGLTFASILRVFTTDSIASTFVVAGGMFGILTIIGMSTNYDLTKIGVLAFVGLIGIILMSLLNFFLQSEALYWLISIAGVIIFVALIARDAQYLKRMATQIDVNSDQGARASIFGALRLYLDFINLFLFLLRFMGRRN
ncbi:MAG TPA: Bax inhibitor-1/YccA family protein [Anaerolineae bacterium]|nr:Bax inhibitor-1/YccA family protein [Anaerolineae bacterium]